MIKSRFEGYLIIETNFYDFLAFLEDDEAIGTVVQY